MKRFASVVLFLCMLAALVQPSIPAVSAATSLPSEIYLLQEGTSTCTLSCAAMMLRARMYLSGNDDWREITESGIKSDAWIPGVGLRNSFTYSINGNSMKVAYNSFGGSVSVETLKSLLDAHPEGIVFHVSDLPHAVFLTDYDGDTFYCAEPVAGYSGKRIRLDASYIGTELGSQENILRTADTYWYVSSYSIGPSQSFDFLDCEDGATISGFHEFLWKQEGYGDCMLTLDIDGIVLAEILPDEDGMFSFLFDTTEYENGPHTIGASIQGANGSAKYVSRTIYINNDVAVSEYSVTYTNASLSLAGDIGVNYYAQLSDALIASEGAYMQFDVAGRTQTIPVSKAEVDADGVYRFSCKVAAKQMTDIIIGQMHLADGTPVGEPKAYSVKSYCDSAIPVYSQYADYGELVALMEAMLNYGAYSQLQLDYNTDILANTDLADTGLPAITEANVAAYAHGAEGGEEGISVSSVSLLLESNTTIRFYFQLDGTKTIDQYTFFVDGVEVTPVESNGQYYVDKVNVAAKDLDQMATVTVGGLTAKYCGLSYVRQVAVLYPDYYDESLINVAKALYAYNQAANAYF